MRVLPLVGRVGSAASCRGNPLHSGDIACPIGGAYRAPVSGQYFSNVTPITMLSHYQQSKNLLVSYSPDALGFF